MATWMCQNAPFCALQAPIYRIVVGLAMRPFCKNTCFLLLLSPRKRAFWTKFVCRIVLRKYCSSITVSSSPRNFHFLWSTRFPNEISHLPCLFSLFPVLQPGFSIKVFEPSGNYPFRGWEPGIVNCLCFVDDAFLPCKPHKLTLVYFGAFPHSLSFKKVVESSA